MPNEATKLKCIAKCLFSYWDGLPQSILGITTAQDSLSFPIVLDGKHYLSRTWGTNKTALPSAKLINKLNKWELWIKQILLLKSY